MVTSGARPCKQSRTAVNRCAEAHRSSCLESYKQRAEHHGKRVAHVHMHTPHPDTRARRRSPKLMQAPLSATSAANAAADSYGMRDFDSPEVCITCIS